MPPDKSLGKKSAKRSSPTRRRWSSAMRRRSAFGRPRSSNPYSTLRRTERHIKIASGWNTMPRSRPGPLMALPSSRTAPVVGSSSPATMFSNVDLPQPEAPIRTTNSSSAISASMPRSTCSWPPPGVAKLFSRFCSTIGIAPIPPCIMHYVSEKACCPLLRSRRSPDARSPTRGPLDLFLDPVDQCQQRRAVTASSLCRLTLSAKGV